MLCFGQQIASSEKDYDVEGKRELVEIKNDRGKKKKKKEN